VYIAVIALVINLVVAAVLTVVFRLMRLPAGSDETVPAHYLAGADEAAPEPEPIPAATAGAT
jgi:SSS family solute:Na+ symporter